MPGSVTTRRQIGTPPAIHADSRMRNLGALALDAENANELEGGRNIRKALPDGGVPSQS